LPPIGVSGVSVKEVVEMIESRIPGGRYVISILLCLLVLTAATASSVYLYHALVLPMVLGAASLLTTGRIAPTTIGALLGSLIGGAVLYVSFRFSIRVLQNMQNTVLKDYRSIDSSLGLIRDLQNDIVRRVDRIESRVSTLEQQGKVLG
jgi:hypothetical protein